MARSHSGRRAAAAHKPAIGRQAAPEGGAELTVLRVFADTAGRWGNPAGVLLEGAAFPPDRRRAVAADIGYSETVFVDDARTGRVRLYGPGGELAFAGHPLVGTAWLLMNSLPGLTILRPPAGPVACWQDGERTWIRASPAAGPAWRHVQLATPAAIDALRAAPTGHDLVQAWAWLDEGAGTVRARTFAPGLAVAEDEACGSASMLLCQRLGQPLTVRHGVGSVIEVRPGPGGAIELGGRVVLDHRRPYGLDAHAAYGVRT